MGWSFTPRSGTGSRGSRHLPLYRRGLALATLSAFAMALLPVVRTVPVSAGTPCPPTDIQSHLPANLSYLVPPGYVDTSDKFQPVVDLMSPAPGRALEDIRFLVNDPATNVSGRPQIDIAGLPAYVVADVARTGTYATYVKQVVITCGAGLQFIVICNGSLGYDLSVMSSGCDAFLKSLAFPASAAMPAGTPCPPIPAVLTADTSFSR